MDFARKSTLAAVIRNNIPQAAVFGVALAFVSVAFMFAMQAKYRADTDFLIVQTGSEGKDFYTLFKSSEYLGNVLANAVTSERFIDAVAENGAIGPKSLPAGKADRLEAWRSMVSVRKNLDLGVLSVTVKTESERDAARIMDGISRVLVERNALFRSGDGNEVEIRTLSGPIIRYNLRAERLAAAAAAGFAAGFFIVLLSAVIRNETAAYGRMGYPSDRA